MAGPAEAANAPPAAAKAARRKGAKPKGAPASKARPPSSTEPTGPDPATFAALAMLGIFVMGVAGAATWHYVFNLGTAVAMLGAAGFVFSVGLSAHRMRKRASGQRQRHE